MADNVALPPSGVNAATDDVAGAHYQKIKLAVGTADSTAMLPSDATAGLKVDLGTDNDVTVTGEVELGATTLAALETIAVTGPLTDVQIRATALPISVATIPSHAVTNAGTFATQVTSIAAGDNNIGNVDVVTLPALVAGAALIGKVGIDQTTPGTTDHVTASLAAAQTLATVTTVGTVSTVTNVVHVDDNSGNLSVDDGGGSLTVDAPVGTPAFVRLSDGSAAQIGQKAMTASLPVVLASDQSALTVSSHAVTNAGTFVTQVDGAALTSLQLIDDPVAVLGTATYSEATTKGMIAGAVRRDADTTAVDTTNEVAPLLVDARGLLKVEAFSGEALPITDNSGSLTVDYATTGSGTATGALRVELPTNGTGVVGITANVLPVPASVGTVTSQADQNTNVTLLSSSATRKGFRITNESTEKLYVKYGATATVTDYTVMIPPGGYLEENFYYGIVDGIWANNASGSARVTSLA